jgi:hypothetical protein
MRVWAVSRSTVPIWLLLAYPAACQVPAPRPNSPEVWREWDLGSHAAQSLDRRDGRITDPAIVEYLQHIEDAIAHAAVAQPLEIRLTRSRDSYATLLPGRVVYLSGGLLERIQNEAELAGLLAHALAHVQQGKVKAPQGLGPAVVREGCVLGSQLPPPWVEEARQREARASEAATGYLKAAGWDPAGVLDLFSKLSYENPAWAKATVPDDLLALRARLEAEPLPAQGYRVESSAFLQAQARLKLALPHAAARIHRPSPEPPLSRKH